jgi:hypothetical protein
VLRRDGIGRLRAELAGWREAGVVNLTVDISELTSCDPALIRVLARALAWARSQLRERGGDLTVTGPIAGFAAYLRTETAALGAVVGSPNDRYAHTPGGMDYRPETADQP